MLSEVCHSTRQKITTSGVHRPTGCIIGRQGGNRSPKTDEDHDGHVDVVHVVLIDMGVSGLQLGVFNIGDEYPKDGSHDHGQWS